MAAYSSKTGNLETFAQQMKLGLFSKEFSDVKFVVGDQRKVIHGHRIIIGLRCPLLQKLFQESSSKPEVPIVLADVSPETFQLMLEFMYTNSVQMNNNSSMDLLGTAIEYGLQGEENLSTSSHLIFFCHLRPIIQYCTKIILSLQVAFESQIEKLCGIDVKNFPHLKCSLFTKEFK